MGNTSIEWTNGPGGEPGYTFNGWLGCTKAHAGCTNCYAEVHQAVAMRQGGRVQWGEVWQGGQRVVVADSTWKKPLAWAREAARAGQRRKVFGFSLGDVLEVPEWPAVWPSRWSEREISHAKTRVAETRAAMDAARERLWAIIRQTSRLCGECKECLTGKERCSALAHRWEGGLDWLLLTKRPENWRLIPEDVRPLVWLGTSISDQATAERWVPRLLSAHGFRYRFLSVEPLLGPVELHSLKLSPVCAEGGEGYACGQQPLVSAFDRSERCGCTTEGAEPLDWNTLDWVIVGGESGSKARRCNVEWIRSIVQQCERAVVPCFVKQLGAAPRFELKTPTGGGFHLPVLNDAKGGDWAEWPKDLRVRQWPGGEP